jgi:hypothetical protein
MTRREGHGERKTPSDATIRSVLRAARGTYRRRFRRVAIAAVIIFVPMDLLVTLSTDAGRRAAEAAEVLAAVLAIAESAASVSGTIIGLTFFAGFVAFIVPGSVLLVLWSILGPLIVIEDLRVFPALPHSARLVWPHFLLALVVVAIPTLLQDVPLSMLERFSWYEQPLVHALIADEKRRRESAT